MAGAKSKFENVDEDGKPCLKFTNEEATEYDWNVQMAIDYDFEPGTTYYIGFDIKGLRRGYNFCISRQRRIMQVAEI